MQQVYYYNMCVVCGGTLVHNSLRVTLSFSHESAAAAGGKTRRVGCFLSSYVTRLGCRLSVSKLLFRAANIVTKFRRHTAPAAAFFINVTVHTALYQTLMFIASLSAERAVRTRFVRLLFYSTVVSSAAIQHHVAAAKTIARRAA